MTSSLKKVQLVLATLALSAYCCSAAAANISRVPELTPLNLYRILRPNQLRNWAFEDGKLSKYHNATVTSAYRDLKVGDEVSMLRLKENQDGGVEVKTRKNVIHHVTMEDFKSHFKFKLQQTYRWTAGTRVTLDVKGITITKMEFNRRNWFAKLFSKTKTKTLKLLYPENLTYEHYYPTDNGGLLPGPGDRRRKFIQFRCKVTAYARKRDSKVRYSPKFQAKLTEYIRKQQARGALMNDLNNSGRQKEVARKQEAARREWEESEKQNTDARRHERFYNELIEIPNEKPIRDPINEEAFIIKPKAKAVLETGNEDELTHKDGEIMMELGWDASLKEFSSKKEEEKAVEPTVEPRVVSSALTVTKEKRRCIDVPKSSKLAGRNPRERKTMLKEQQKPVKTQTKKDVGERINYKLESKKRYLKSLRDLNFEVPRALIQKLEAEIKALEKPTSAKEKKKKHRTGKWENERKQINEPKKTYRCQYCGKALKYKNGQRMNKDRRSEHRQKCKKRNSIKPDLVWNYQYPRN